MPEPKESDVKKAEKWWKNLPQAQRSVVAEYMWEHMTGEEKIAVRFECGDILKNATRTASESDEPYPILSPP